MYPEKSQRRSGRLFQDSHSSFREVAEELVVYTRYYCHRLEAAVVGYWLANTGYFECVWTVLSVGNLDTCRWYAFKGAIGLWCDY